ADRAELLAVEVEPGQPAPPNGLIALVDEPSGVREREVADPTKGLERDALGDGDWSARELQRRRVERLEEQVPVAHVGEIARPDEASLAVLLRDEGGPASREIERLDGRVPTAVRGLSAREIEEALAARQEPRQTMRASPLFQFRHGLRCAAR